MYRGLENLRNKKGKFTNRTQLANGESISRSFFYITIDSRVYSDWAKTIIVT